MGRETKNFRQTAKSNAANQAVKNYAKVNRQGAFNKANISKLNKEVK